jgi:hypothetical protein
MKINQRGNLSNHPRLDRFSPPVMAFVSGAGQSIDRSGAKKEKS